MRRPLVTPGSVRRAVFSPEARGLATPGEDGTVRLWDPAAGQLILDPL